MKKPMRIYADTSVFGGACDREFKDLSKTFFERVHAGDIVLYVSAVTIDELDGAPENVRAFFESISPDVKRLEIGEDAYALRQAYLQAGVVSPKWAADALHVAVASVNGCHAIVSWNFKHIVNYRRISLYNGVNLIEGYTSIAIHTPPEVVIDEE